MDTLINDLHPQDRPQEKLTRLSPEALSDKELLALILGKGHATDKTMEQAGKILASFPGGLKSLSYETLRRVKGLGANGAATLAAAYELAKRDNSKDYRPVLDSPSRVMEQIPAEVRNGRKEHFIALYLNARSQLIRYETVSIGTLSASLVHPREVFGPGIAHSAAALVVAHNLCDASHKLCNVKSNIM
jgi:DNA repair protein RadC